jgi:hypothetical protein
MDDNSAEELSRIQKFSADICEHSRRVFFVSLSGYITNLRLSNEPHTLKPLELGCWGLASTQHTATAMKMEECVY